MNGDRIATLILVTVVVVAAFGFIDEARKSCRREVRAEICAGNYLNLPACR